MRELLTTRGLLVMVSVLSTLVIVPAFTYGIRRKFPSVRTCSFWFLFLRIITALTVGLMVYEHIAGATLNLNSDHRLAPTAALMHGYPVYYPPEQGPALSTIYGPVTVWTYIPAAALFKSPMNAVRSGTAINMLMYYASAVFLLWVTSTFSASASWAGCALAMFALTTFNKTLDSASGLLHADAPAIGWGAIACAFGLLAVSGRAGWYSVAAGLTAAFSILSKQVMLPLLPVLGIFLLIVCGRCALTLYAASAAGFTAALLALASWSMGGWQAIVYNILYIPTHQPYLRSELIPAIGELADMSAAFGIAAAAAVSIQIMSSPKVGVKDCLRQNPSLLLLGAGLALSTTSILGRIKVVGSVNTLSPSVYFFLAAALVELQRLSFPGMDAGRIAGLRRAVVGSILSFFVLVQLPIALYNLTTPAMPDRMQAVYTFSQKHPGEIYFPQFPLSVLLGENRLYHFAWGLSDRAEAGRPVSGEYFRRYIPASSTVAAMVDWVWTDEIFRYLGKQVERPELSELPGFKFYEIRKEPLLQGEPTSMLSGETGVGRD
jgi:hypothetical protein